MRAEHIEAERSASIDRDFFIMASGRG